MVINPKNILYNLIVVVVGSVLALSIVTLPFFIFYRLLIVFLAKCFRPDFESIASGIDVLFAMDIGRWDTKPEEGCVITLTLKAKPSYEKAHIFFQELLTDKKYEHMCQYIVPWLGYGFWKKENPFLMENHLLVVDNKEDEVRDEKWLSNFTKKLLKDPFGKMQSPWDIHIVSDYQPKHESDHVSAVLFRIHHSLSDGHSTLKMLSKAFDNYLPITYEKPSQAIQYSQLQTVITRLLSPYKHLKSYLEAFEWNNRMWTNFSGEMSLAHSKIPIEKILLVRQKYKTGINSIIYAGVTTALRNILLRKNSKIPPKIYLGFPTPKENHPNHLCNHYIVSFLPISIGNCDPVGRLLSINSSFDKVNASDKTEVTDFLVNLMGYLPYILGHLLFSFPASGTCTVFPLGSQNAIFGCPIGDYQASFAVPAKQVSAGVVIMGAINNGYVYLSGSFDKSILATDELAGETMKDIGGYLDSLLQN